MKLINLSGKRFGQWVVVKYHGQKRWVCKCDCGHEGTVASSNLIGGLSTKCRKCGPGFVANKLPQGVAAFNDLVTRYKQSAKVRGLHWSLSIDEAKLLLEASCFYCGSEPFNIWPKNNLGKLNGTFSYSGIDRVDSSKSYSRDNCVPCCKKCNYMKRDLSVKDFFSHVKLIVNKLEAL